MVGDLGIARGTLVGAAAALRHGKPSARIDTRSRGDAISPLCVCAEKLEPVMWPLGGEVPRLERCRPDRVAVASHEHRDHHLGLDAQALLERAADAPHDALLVAANRTLG